MSLADEQQPNGAVSMFKSPNHSPSAHNSIEYEHASEGSDEQSSADDDENEELDQDIDEDEHEHEHEDLYEWSDEPGSSQYDSLSDASGWEFEENKSAPWLEEETFHSFQRLPVEIRLQIWKLATPDPRDVNGPSVIFHLNFDLSNAKAILLSPKELMGPWPGHSEIAHKWNKYLERHPDESDWRRRLRIFERDCSCNTCSASKSAWSGPACNVSLKQVLSLLHVCREARMTVQKVYVLTVMTSVRSDFLPWDSNDTLYFPSMHHKILFRYVFVRFRKRPYLFFDAIHRIAIHVVPQGPPSSPYNPTLHPNLLTNLPNLRSIDGVIDPQGVSMRDTGSLVLYESLDVPVERLGHQRPSEVESRINSQLKLHASYQKGKVEPATFELSVLGWKAKNKRG
ncbi:hypothetical protein GLAREA_10419 [Glarea lozoyensis ATCC 20868]|uniref:2EXR domain-containing protein n=1 Tax=Glarea lozoyensis (strain ATCC 20868 / MF5171) TaxID=1116229 RepID=S3DAJ1_GLAL2|nr:uncharacterized protein GLAREA_10419 [Glarea lozoyensis ATCC 20868]EPE34725.1 hypothetical protein GLAREA_10419 [Glarea lozoyensis ATCC 20868]